MAAYEQWYIGSTAGGGSRGVEGNSVEICAEETADADWFEWHDEQWTKSDNIQIKCVDDIICSCQNLDIFGFQYQSSKNGRYVLTDSLLNGRGIYRQSNDANSLYFMARYEEWYIGSTSGGGSRGVEVKSVEMCAEKTADADWFLSLIHI